MPRFQDDFPRWSKPLPARGGIHAQSKHGPFGKRWWAKRWIAVIESFQLGSRLTRGRSYARRGQVTTIAIEPGKVAATVQGSREDPYAVTIEMKPLTSVQWRDVAARISESPRFVAMLLNAEVPVDIEIAFRAAGCELFPNSVRDVQTACSCPDASNPCKHVAAVYYLLGEEFDRDPFSLFALRGLRRNELLAALKLDAPGAPQARSEQASDSEPPLPQSEAPLPDSPTLRPPLDAPPVDAWPLRRAGRFPFWNGTIPLDDALAALYRDAGADAAEMLAETWPDTVRESR